MYFFHHKYGRTCGPRADNAKYEYMNTWTNVLIMARNQAVKKQTILN